MNVDPAGNCKKKTAIVLGLILLILAVYWQVQNHNFIGYDDYTYVKHNYAIQTSPIFSKIIYAFSDFHTGNWHPVTMLSHALDWELFGDNAGGHHWTNLIFHMINTVLLFILLNSMTGAVWRSALVAALFAVHPINVESVAWVAERKNVLSTFFWFLTMLFYVWYVRKPDWKRYLAVLICFALGLMSKSMLVTLPFVLLLMDYWPLNRTAIDTHNVCCKESNSLLPIKKEKVRLLLWEKVPFFILSGVIIAVTLYTQWVAGAVADMTKLPFSWRIGNAIVSYGLYIRKLFLPLDLLIFYPQSNIEIWKILFALLLVFFFTVIAICYYRRLPYVSIGWFWFLGTLVPMIGLIQVGMQSMADRYVYVPFIGLFIMMIWLVGELALKNKFIRSSLSMGFLLFLLFLSIIAWQRVQVWGDQIALWSDVLKDYQVSFAYNMRGIAYAEQGQYHLALKDYHTAIELDGKHAEALNNRANLYLRIGRKQRALNDYDEAQRVSPNYINTYFNRGLLYLSMGQSDKAIGDFTKFIRFEPNMADAFYHRGRAFQMKGDNEQSLADFNRAIQINPANAVAYFSRAMLLTFLRKDESAIVDYRQVLNIDPRHKESLTNLAVLLKRMKRYDEASDQYEKILRIDPGDKSARESLKEIKNLQKLVP